MIRYYVFQAEEPTEGFFVEVAKDTELKDMVKSALDDIQGGELRHFTQKANGHHEVDWADYSGEVFVWEIVPQHDKNTYRAWTVDKEQAA